MHVPNSINKGRASLRFSVHARIPPSRARVLQLRGAVQGGGRSSAAPKHECSMAAVFLQLAEVPRRQRAT